MATATVFFHRFYLKNLYCETDPFLVISACVYVAAKAEESPIHIKNIVTESRSLFSHTPYFSAAEFALITLADHYNMKHFPSDNSKLGEVEFYLVDDLECDLTIFYPYRTLLALCRKEATEDEQVEVETGELSVGIDADDLSLQPQAKFEMSESALQTVIRSICELTSDMG